MKPARVDYMRPLSLEAALQLLTTHGPDAAILGGGQSLMPMLNLRVAAPSILVDINAIAGMNEIVNGASGLQIGAVARHNDVLRSPLVADCAPLLAQALKHVAHEAIRNRGTLGGSLALADPAAELPACMVCLEANIVIVSSRGERVVEASDFFQGIYETALEPDELILRVEIPASSREWRCHFDERARRHGDFAIAGLALMMELEGDAIVGCKIVYAGLEAFPRRLVNIEDALLGIKLGDDERIDAVIKCLGASLDILDGGEYPVQYRLRLAGHLLRNGIGAVGRSVMS